MNKSVLYVCVYIKQTFRSERLRQITKPDLGTAGIIVPTLSEYYTVFSKAPSKYNLDSYSDFKLISLPFLN